MKKTLLPLSKVYRLLEPGPVVLLTSARGPMTNVMAMSWHMMVDFEPPTVACVISDRNYTFELVKKTKECVINIPTVELIKKVVGCGNVSGRRVNKFKKFRLTPTPATCVAVPLISECSANLECKVIDASMAHKYNIFILSIVKAWVDRKRKTRGRSIIAGEGFLWWLGEE